MPISGRGAQGERPCRGRLLAEWCGPCAIAPALDEISGVMGDKVGS
jgi:hypothetical protein